MLSILMPVYNERERVERAIAEVLETELPSDFELIVVDDGSTDGTRAILRNGDWGERVRLYEHEITTRARGGHPNGPSQARGEFAAIFDADLEYDPEDLALLMPPLLDGRANACFGVRAFDGLHQSFVPVRARQQGCDAGLQRALQRVSARTS